MMCCGMDGREDIRFGLSFVQRPSLYLILSSIRCATGSCSRAVSSYSSVCSSKYQIIDWKIFNLDMTPSACVSFADSGELG